MRENPRTAQNNVISSCSFLSSVVVALFLMGCNLETKHLAWKNATGAEQYERLMWQAIRDKDWKNAQYHLAPTFVGVDSSGQALDREAWLEHWKTAQIKDFSLAEVSVQPQGANMAVTYIFHASPDLGPPTASGAGLRVVSIWQQIKGGWILIATSQTPVSAR